MYYHWKKQAAAGGPCSDMSGFTRLVASEGAKPDGLEAEMPSVFVKQMTPEELARPRQPVESALCPVRGQRPTRPPGGSKSPGRSYATQSAAWAAWKLAVTSVARPPAAPKTAMSFHLQPAGTATSACSIGRTRYSR